jgi:hypothetical protein
MTTPGFTTADGMFALDVEQTAKRCCLGQDAIRSAERSGDLIGTWVGKRLVFLPEEIAAWLATRPNRRAA